MEGVGEAHAHLLISIAKSIVRVSKFVRNIPGGGAAPVSARGRRAGLPVFLVGHHTRSRRNQRQPVVGSAGRRDVEVHVVAVHDHTGVQVPAFQSDPMTRNEARQSEVMSMAEERGGQARCV